MNTALARAAKSVGVAPGKVMIDGEDLHTVLTKSDAELALLASEARRRAIKARHKSKMQAESARLERIEGQIAELSNAIGNLLRHSEKLAALLAADVVPDYDERGKIVRARRVVKAD